MKCIWTITLFYCREQCCATSEIINTANKRGRVADAEDRWKNNPPFYRRFFHDVNLRISLLGLKCITLWCNYTIWPLRKLASDSSYWGQEWVNKHERKHYSSGEMWIKPDEIFRIKDRSNTMKFKRWHFLEMAPLMTWVETELKCKVTLLCV